MKKVGRPAGEVLYRDVVFNNKEYIVGRVMSNNEYIKFVFDKDDFEKVNGKVWHKCAGHYISSSIFVEDKKKELFLHNLVMGNLEHPGKGAKETIDHINRNGFDNRKENLRLISQTEQNMNQTKRGRYITLPEGCGITPEEIPRHIWYIKAQGAHGDRFAIEFKTEGLCWKTTSSKKVTLKDKLQEAKEKLKELYLTYPHLNPFQEDKIKRENELNTSFNEIVSMAVF